MDNGKLELAKLREEIDQLDHELLEILRQRYRLVEKVAKIKQKYKLPILQKSRWESMIKEHTKRALSLKINPNFVQSLMKLIHKESIRLQKEKIEVKK